MIAIEFSGNASAMIDADRLRRAVEEILCDAGIDEGEISVALVDDATIHALNRKFLAHDSATNVLSFVLDRDGSRLEGEVVASVDTAQRVAAQFGWSADDELLLYVIHGTLHLVGLDDLDRKQSTAMRAAERRYLALFGLTPRADNESNE